MNADAPLPGTKRIGVIGAGFGGLALAMRLQAAGLATTLIEAREAPGGRASGTERDGFRFSSGPAALSDRSGLDELWALAGTTLEHDVSLLPVTPLCRYSWPDGTQFDILGDDPGMVREVARIAPGDMAGYEEFCRLAKAMMADFRTRPGPAPFADYRALATAAPQLARNHGWRSLWSFIAAQVKDEHLREALAAPALIQGANPFTASALLAAEHMRERLGGLWWPEGGMARLAKALLARFEALGGTARLHDPVLEVRTIGNRVNEVVTQSGWHQRFDAIASSADLVHTWRDLLGDTARGADRAGRLRRRSHAPGLFTVHFALEGSWPGIPHCMTLMGPRFRELVNDIYEHGVLPQDQIIWLSHPSLTDPTLAPPGKSVFQATVPVAHLGKLPIDWEAIGPMLEQRVLDEVGRRLVPDIRDRIITSFHQTPRDLALEFNAAFGSGFGLDPPALTSGRIAQPLRDRTLNNFYIAGGVSAPGAGLPGTLAAARTTARLILEDIT